MSALFSLENLLTNPKLFGLTTATPIQRAKCRIIEGKPLGELADDSTVQEMLGGKQAIPLLPKTMPREVLDISAIRIGKSLFAGALLFWMAQTADLSKTIKSDIVRIFVVALNKANTEAVVKHFHQNIIDKPLLRAALVEDPAELSMGRLIREGCHLRRPDGRIVEITPVVLDRGGGAAVSVYCAGVVVDEYPRMYGATDGVKNIEHFRSAVIGRILPDSMFFATGSPWQPYGPAYDNTIKFFGKPNDSMVVFRTSAWPFMDVAPNWTEKTRALLEKTDPIAYRTDFLAEFADGEQAVFPAQAIEDAWKHPVDHEADYARPAIFADPSALRHDYWAAMVGGWVYPAETFEDLYEVEQLGEFITPGRGQVVVGRKGWIRILEDDNGRPIPKKDVKPRRPWFEVYDIKSWDKNSGARGTDLVKAVGDMGRQYHCRDFHWDGYEQLMLSDLIRQQDLRPVIHSWSGQGRKTEAVDHLRTLFIERRVRLPEHEKLKQELVRFRARATPGGNFQYIVAGGDGHGDHASCLTLASRADLDGFVDRSPTKTAAKKTEVLDYDDRFEM